MGKKATKKEVQDRVDYVVRLMAAGMRSSDIIQNSSVKSWGVTDRQAWKYIDKALKYFKDKANIDRDGELGKILEQYEFLFIQALKAEDYRLCVTILDKRGELIGLKRISVDVGGEIGIKIKAPEGLNKDDMV